MKIETNVHVVDLDEAQQEVLDWHVELHRSINRFVAFFLLDLILIGALVYFWS